MAEVGVRGAGSDDEIVVGNFLLDGKHEAALEIEAGDLFQ